MANPMNTNLPGAVAVPASKFIKNAEHVGAAQAQGKAETKVNDAPPSTPAPDEVAKPAAAPPPPPQEEALPQGIRAQTLPDGGQQYLADSGVRMKTSQDGTITNVNVPGDGVIAKDEKGKLTLRGLDGAHLPVEGFSNDHGDFLKFVRNDKTEVFVNLGDLTVGYLGKHKDVLQEVLADGSQVIHADSAYKDPQGKISQLQSKIHLNAFGEVEHVEGYDKDLKVTAGRVEFRNPSNGVHKIDLPNRIAGMEPAEPEVKPAAEAPPTQGPARPNAPGVMQNPSNMPELHMLLPSQVGMDRDAQGQTGIMLRNGVTMLYTEGAAIAKDKSGQTFPVNVQDFTSADGRREKYFQFKDSNGTSYLMFQQSMDVFVESKDGQNKVIQHILPNGAILGQVQGDDGRQYKFEVTPRGEYRTDSGLVFQPTSGDNGQCYLQGPNGQAKAINIPYPIPQDQANAGMYADIYGNQNYPQSGQILQAFQNNPANPGAGMGQRTGMGQQVFPNHPFFQQAGANAGAPPNPGPMPGPMQNPGFQTSNRSWDPNVGLNPDPMAQMGNPMPPMGPGPMGPMGPGPMGPGPMGPGPTIFPHPGMPQQPVQPGLLQRLKYMFTGNPSHLFPRGGPCPPPPPWMGGYQGNQWGCGPQGPMGPMGPMGPGPMGPMGPGPMGPMNPSYQPYQGGFGGQMPGGGYSPIPGGPGYPSNYNNTQMMIQQFQMEMARNSQMMMATMAMGNISNTMLATGTMFHSLFSNMSYNAALYPCSYFMCPFF